MKASLLNNQAKPVLSNIQLDYAPAAYLTHSSAVGKLAARRSIDRIEAGAADPDEIFLALKEMIGVELPAGALAQIRTYSRLMQRALEEGETA